MSRLTIKTLSFLLLFSLAFSTVAVPVEAVPASDYIHSYSASISRTSSGVVRVSYCITGMGKMDEIGATTIYLYESIGSSWALVKTFKHTQSAYSSMMDSYTSMHSGYVTYSGTAGKQYYASVSFWAGKGGDGDTASKSTSSVTA